MALIDKASLLMVPSTYEAGKLYNVLPSGNRAPDSTDQNSGYDQTRADFDFDRGSNAAATRVNSDGLIEKYRENLLVRSNQFDTTWTNNNTTETSGQSGYDGTNDAWLLSKSAASGYIVQLNSSTNVQTFSVYAKANTRNWIQLLTLGSGTGSAVTFFDLENGVVGSSGGSGTYRIDSNIEAVGTDGWYRCSITINTNLYDVRIYPAESDNDTSGTSGSIFIQNAQLESGLVATEVLTSGATTGKAGVLVDLPRINYDANGENGSLLLEPSRQQLIQYSEYIQGTFSPINSNFTANSGISPEGVQNSTAVNVTSLTNGYCFHTPSVAAGVDYIFSAYYKGTAGETLRMRTIYDGNTTEKLVTLTGDWQREEISVTGGSGSTLLYLYDARLGNLTATNFEVFGAQLEAGSYPSSYIPNHGESGGVTRAADSCTGAGDASTFNDSEGVLYADIAALADDLTNRYITISDGSANNRLSVFFTTASNKVIFSLYVGGVLQSYISNSSTDTTQINKIACKWKENDFALWVNGVEVATDTNGITFPVNTLDRLDLSYTITNLFNFYGNVKQVAVFNEALSDSELATLTTL